MVGSTLLHGCEGFQTGRISENSDIDGVLHRRTVILVLR